MIRLTFFLALATAWCADAVLMLALAEARWGSIMNRFLGAMLLGLAVIALTVAIGPVVWRVIERLSVRLLAYWTFVGVTHATRRTVTPAPLATPTY